MTPNAVETLCIVFYCLTILIEQCTHQDSHSRFTRRTENLPAFGTWLVLISDPAHQQQPDWNTSPIHTGSHWELWKVLTTVMVVKGSKYSWAV